MSQLAQKELDESCGGAGFYRVYPIAWTVEPSTKPNSQSVAIVFQFMIHQRWTADQSFPEGGQWSQDWAPGYFVYGRSYVVGADGKLNAQRVKELADAGLYREDWNYTEENVPRVFAIVDVGADEYNGKTRYRANWINPNTDVPKARAGFAPASDELLQQLRTRFGSEGRAIVGGKAPGRAPAPPGAAPAAHASAIQPATVAPAGPPVSAPVRPPRTAPAPSPMRPNGPPPNGPPPAMQPPAMRPPAQPHPAQQPMQPPTYPQQQAQPPAAPANWPPAGFGDPAGGGQADDPIDPGKVPF